jgi:spermidine/putrescine transport system substrate-binding protein
MKIHRLVSLLILPLMVLAACAPAPSAPVVAPTQAMPAAPEATTAAPEAPTVAAGAAKPSSTELNLYGWTDYIPQQLLDDFTSQYGFKVNYDTYSSNV